MATAPELIDHPPAGIAGSQSSGESAEIIQLLPLPDERGFSYQDLIRPGRLARGLGNLAAQARDLAWDQLLADDDGLERVEFTYKGHDHLVLVSDPDPATGIKPAQAPKIWLKPGLTELADVGSPVWLHNAVAKRNPGSQVMTHATKGMSHGGQAVPAGEAAARWIDIHAAEDLAVLAEFASGQPVDVDGTSWGSFDAAHMAVQNLRAKDGRQVDIRKLNLISSPVIACEVDPEEDFREPDLDEAALRATLTDEFNKHVLSQTIGLLKHPRQLRAVWKVAPAYLMYPEKAVSRAKIIKADLRSVQQGFGWHSLRLLASQLDEIHFVLGKKDPLTAPQRPQIQALQERSPSGSVKLTLIESAGHFATADAEQVANAIYGEPAALPKAA